MRNRIRNSLLAALMLLTLTACGATGSSPTVADEQPAKKELFAMDTYMTMTAYGRTADVALEEASAQLTELEKLWSVTDPDSDLYAVNHGDGEPVSVNEKTAELLSFAMRMAEETGGALEPTIYPVLTAWGFTTGENRIPSKEELTALLQNTGYKNVRLEQNMVWIKNGMMLDLGSVGKGYAGDLAAQVLKNHGITSAVLDLGGNVQTVGAKPDGSPWRLGLRDPFSDGVLGVLEVTDQAVVTSGAYERYFVGEGGKRYGHIIDPSTGYPAESGLASVTVVAGEGLLCDALSTSLYVMGADQAINYWRQHRNFDMILISEDKEIYLTGGIADRFALDSNYSDMIVHTIQN